MKTITKDKTFTNTGQWAKHIIEKATGEKIEVPPLQPDKKNKKKPAKK